MRVSWIAVDWGTTHLRIWALDEGNALLDERQSDQGMGVLAPGEFEPALLALASDWLSKAHPVSVLACGMVGARQGWAEAPYRAVPCAPLAEAFQSVPCDDPRLEMWIIPGLMQTDPADVMRGEETQVGGFLSAHPGFEGVIGLPGTHTKWVEVAEGAVLSFSTAMTGELFALLEKRSVLRHSVVSDEFDEAAFRAVVQATVTDPSSAELFSIRAEDLLQGASPGKARAKLSAMLIGTEVAAMKQRLIGRDVVLLGAPALTALYQIALRAADIQADIHDGSGATLNGLIAAKSGLKEGRAT